MPTQIAMDRNLFEIRERTINSPDGSIRITKTPKVTGRVQIYFVNKLLNAFGEKTENTAVYEKNYRAFIAD